MENIRQLKQDELQEDLILSQFAFQYELSEEDRRKKTFKNPEQYWGYFVDGRLAAKLRILPLQTFIQGKTFSMGGIASVATWPEYRRKGMVAQLLKRALEEMRERKMTVSFLAPFSFGFYRKFGWEAYVDYKNYTMETALLPRWERPDGRIERIGRQWELLNGIYEAYARQFNGMLKRDESWWNERVFEKLGSAGQIAVYCDRDHQAAGYMLYKVKESAMSVDEIVFLNETARRALWRFIADHDSMIEKVSVRAPLHDRLSALTDNPRFKQEVVPYFMARIVDAKAFIEQYPFAAQEQTHVLQIEDEHAPWNEGLFEVAIDASGKAGVRQLAVGSETDGRSTIRLSIQSLMALLMSAQPADFLLACGKIAGSESAVRVLADSVPVKQTYLTDYF